MKKIARFNLIAVSMMVGLATTLPVQAKEYLVGGMYTYTYDDGRYADWGDFALQASQMAIEDINASGMLGEDTLNMPKELIIDYHCWPEGAADKARSLLQQDVIAITGVDCSGPAVEIAKVAEEFKTPALSYGANAANLSSVTEFPYFYRNVTPSTRYDGYLLDVAKHFGLDDIALFYTTDAWGIGAANEIQSAAQRAGMTVQAAYGYPRNTPVEDVQKRMAQVKAAGIKNIFITMPTPDTVTAFKTLNNLDMNQPGYAFFAAEMTSADEKPDAINGAIGYFAPMTMLGTSPELDAFADRFEKQIGKKVDKSSKAFFYAVLGYDHMMALGHAIQDAKSDQVTEVIGELLMPYLRKVSFNGLSGRNNLAEGTNDRDLMSVALMNCQGYQEDGVTVNFVPVGFVDALYGKLTLQENQILWPGNVKTAPGR